MKCLLFSFSLPLSASARLALSRTLCINLEAVESELRLALCRPLGDDMGRIHIATTVSDRVKAQYWM
jgi:hypothetical protein